MHVLITSRLGRLGKEEPPKSAFPTPPAQSRLTGESTLHSRPKLPSHRVAHRPFISRPLSLQHLSPCRRRGALQLCSALDPESRHPLFPPPPHFSALNTCGSRAGFPPAAQSAPGLARRLVASSRGQETRFPRAVVGIWPVEERGRHRREDQNLPSRRWHERPRSPWSGHGDSGQSQPN